jgi:DNA-binding MarR family transcriptional regulator
MPADGGFLAERRRIVFAIVPSMLGGCMAGPKPSAQTTPSPRRSLPRSRRAQASFDDFLPYLITRLAYDLNLDLIDKLRPRDINLARWRILAVLAMGDGLTVNEIIERSMMQQSALSRVLMKMEAEHYLRREPRRDDARYVQVFLTDKGRRLFQSLDPVVRRRQERLLAGFSADEVEAAFPSRRNAGRSVASAATVASMSSSLL